MAHFGDDLVEAELHAELSMLKNIMPGMSFSIDYFKEKLIPYQPLFPQISNCQLLQLQVRDHFPPYATSILIYQHQ